MLSVPGIYENGQIRLLEPIPEKKFKVIVTVMEEIAPEPVETKKIPPDIFDDLIGVVEEKEDGSVNHDAYINAEHRP